MIASPGLNNRSSLRVVNLDGVERTSIYCVAVFFPTFTFMYAFVAGKTSLLVYLCFYLAVSHNINWKEVSCDV